MVNSLLFAALFAAVFNVRDYGAKGDGVTLDTVAIQRAIDAANKAGGGRVLLENGVFKSGTIYLKSHIEFHLAIDAKLFGSDRLEDYNALDAFPQNFGHLLNEGWQGKHLVLCIEQQDVAMTGDGVIDGNGEAFFDTELRYPSNYIAWRFGMRNSKGYTWQRQNSNRPGQMVEFCECRDIRIRDLRFVNSTAWTCFFHGCEDVQVRGIRVENDYRCANTDGIDIDSCRNVTVSDCIFRTGDDAIAIRGDPVKLKDPTRVCENILIENCTAFVSACGIRIGVGTGTIRHVVINNYIVQQAEHGLWLCSKYASRGGTEISDVQISNMSIRRSPYAVWIEGAGGQRPRNVMFSNLMVFEDDTVPDRPMLHLKDADAIAFNGCRISREGGVSRPLDLAKDISDLPHVYPKK